MTLPEQSLRVLVVDDEALVRWSISELLRRQGHSVVEVASAGAARHAVNDAVHPIDVVLLDYRLPDSSDLALLEEVRRATPRSAVILMTAYGTPEIVDGALRRGAFSVLDKPFDLHDLEVLVRNAHQATRRH